LYLIGVPIGHPDDITIRALRLLSSVDIVAAKRPQETEALLAHHNVRATLTTYDRETAHEKVPLLIERLEQGSSIALVSDCGMPGVYDVGSLLVRAAAERGIAIVMVPGPSVATAALTLSGLEGNRVSFEGACPTGDRALQLFVKKLETQQATVVLFLDPKQVVPLLRHLSTSCGDRTIMLAGDLTMEQEEIIRGNAHELLKRELPGSLERLVLVMEGRRTGVSTRRVTGSKASGPAAS
jgi:16S rRNA (cytidine1402-2'-O)-methyltransferase